MQKIFVILLVGLLFTIHTKAQNNYQIDVTKVKTEVIKGHLNLGGKNIYNDSIAVNSFYLERNGKPFIPVIGEFHYSRYPNQYWDEEIKKMKAGGITIIATYVFWNLHEPKEGKFCWKDDLDVRKFVELCAKNHVEVLMRIGPFAHGEMRNGGLPDWLYGRPIEVRTNDPAYLGYTKRLYTEIAKQLNGLMFKDGGPVLAVQLENEYQHSAAPWGFGYMDAPRERTVGRRDNKITQDGVGINNEGNEFANTGSDHMKTLRKLAVDAGLIAPLYTVTGWGRATIVEKGSIPVMAGYAYPFWSASNSPSQFYLYKDLHKTPDYSPVSYDTNLYPSMAAELGTGMAVTYARRPRVPEESFLPLMVRTVGSGTNGLGFYMYHGGTTPSEGNFFLSEGWGLNNKSYDYQAPIGEYGLINNGFKSLKIINSFLNYFGSDLAPLYPVIPNTNDSIKPTNTSTLRYAVRSNGNKGYLFMHNFQDHFQVVDINGIKIHIQTQSGQITFPESGTMTLKAGSSAIFPFNTTINGVAVKMATIQPFSCFTNNSQNYAVMVSIDGIQPEILIKGKVNVKGTGIKVSRKNGHTLVVFKQGKVCEMQVNGQKFLILPYEQALNAFVVGKNNAQRILISSALILNNDSLVSLISNSSDSIFIASYPAINTLHLSNGLAFKKESAISSMSQWKIELKNHVPNIKLLQVDDRHFVLRAPSMDWNEVNDVFLTFDYRGDRAVCMMNGELQTDNLYTSQPWTIGLKRYSSALKSFEMYFYFIPMQKDAPYIDYLDKNVRPDFSNKKEFLEIKKPIITVEYKTDLFWSN